jgi:hypothetical protein
MGRYACQWTMGGIDCESTMIRMSNYVVYGWQNYPTQSDGLISHFLFSTIYINIWDNPSHWLIFFKMVKPPTRYFFFVFAFFCSMIVSRSHLDTEELHATQLRMMRVMESWLTRCPFGGGRLGVWSEWPREMSFALDQYSWLQQILL